MFEAPKIIGLKNIILINSTANSLLCPENPGAIRETIAGVKIINIILVSIVLVLLVLQSIFPTAILLSYIGAGVTVCEVLFLIIQLSFNFEQRAISHKNSALKFMGLRDNYRSLITDVMNESIDANTVMAKRDTLQHQYQVICDLAPQTGKTEYDEAQKRLNKRGIVPGEEFTWSDEEIDWFLPENLRLK